MRERVYRARGKEGVSAEFGGGRLMEYNPIRPRGSVSADPWGVVCELAVGQFISQPRRLDLTGTDWAFVGWGYTPSLQTDLIPDPEETRERRPVGRHHCPIVRHFISQNLRTVASGARSQKRRPIGAGRRSRGSLWLLFARRETQAPIPSAYWFPLCRS